MSSPRLSIIDLIWQRAVNAPEHPALIFLGNKGRVERFSYAELTSRTARRISRISQLPPCSRVGLNAPHGPEFLIEALAILAAGHCLVPINGELDASEQQELAVRAGIHALRQTSDDSLTLFPGAAIDGQSDNVFRALSPAYLRFTSGSTGQRKGVLLGHPTIIERTAAANLRLQIGAADRVLCLLPMVDHFVVSILLYLRYGATVLLVENDMDAPALAGSERATVLYGSPAQYRSFRTPLPSLRLAVSTAQGLTVPLAEAFLAVTGQPLTQALGIIEAGLLTLNETLARTEPLLAGKPMPSYKISVAENDGNGGEIHVQGPGLLDAYVSPWQPRESLLTKDGFPTGDHGWLDDEGYLHLVGREKNRLHFGEATFFCEEIESRINQHGAVTESLVSRDGEQLVAKVVAPNADWAVLASWIRNAVSSISAPVEVQFVEFLPRTATGKLAR